MFILHPLLQISVLLDATLWLAVFASPTDDNVLRAGHGEHGEPGHEEPHKDSYSTFASEFLESRYLSDEGTKELKGSAFIKIMNVVLCRFSVNVSAILRSTEYM